MSTVLYGINNCDTVKKALKWLNERQIDFDFYDFKKQAISAELLATFAALSDWEQLINKRSTTFRNLAPDIKQNFTAEVALQQALQQPTLLKRPLLLHQDKLYLGFTVDNYQAIFDHA